MSSSSESDEDVTLVLDDGHRLVCAKGVLCRSSPYFKAMFSPGFSESSQTEVYIRGPLESSSVEELLCHAKGLELHLSEENVFSILHAAGMLQFEVARKSCCSFLKQTMRPYNLLKVFSVADLLGESELRKLALCKIIWNFCSTISANSNNLMEISPNLLKELLDNPHLRVSSEMDIFQVISDWVDFDADIRSTHFVDLFKCLRIEEMSEQDLSDLLNYHLVSESEDAKNIVESELRRKKEEKSGTVSSDPEISGGIRRKRGPVFLPCVVGQLADQHWLFGYDKRTNQLEKLLLLDKVTMGGSVYASGYQVIAAGPIVYVIGGEFMLGRSNWNKAVWSYDTITREWSHALTLDVPRRHFSTCLNLFPPGNSNEGQIFLVGGFGKHRIILDLMDSIDLTTNELEDCPVMSVNMYSPAVCFFRGRVFVLKNSIHSYHPEYEFWSMLNNYSMPKDVEFKKAMAASDHIYLTANHKSELFRFDPDKNAPENTKLEFEVVGTFANLPENVCLIEEDGIIYNFSKATIETFDTKSGVFKVVWEETETESLEFSPNFSFGCFPMVKF